MTSLAIYIHWPFCKSKCPYCDFNSHVRDSVDQERWKKALLQELGHIAAHVPSHTATSIFFGGGTPSLMPPATAEALIARVHELWPVTQDIEITLEANPTSVETNTFSDFKKAGVNRVSLGVQSLDDKELQFLGRGHSSAEARKAIEFAANIFDRYTFDLIYARPNQTLETWEKELTEALALARGHLSLYQLTIEENTAFHHAYKKGEFALPDEELSEQLYRTTEQAMESHGLFSYEVSNYASPGQESRHNLSYWKGDDYIGIGPGAHGRLELKNGRIEELEKNKNAFPQFPNSSVRVATATLKSPERWLEKVEKIGNGLEVFDPIDKNTELAERVMMGLRLTDGINFQNFNDKTGVAFFDSVNKAKYSLFVQKNLLKETKNSVSTTLTGRLLLNRLTAELLN
jgi:putative oxygen-independent coproporphyrinogen III oxidase